MYWILLVMGALVAVVAALIAGGLTTPRAHVVARTVVLRAPLELVWTTIRAVDGYASWRPELTESVASTGDDGEEWRESTRTRSMRLGVVRDEPPHRFAMRILDDDLPVTGEWEWVLESTDGGTRVTLAERGEIGNPIVRFTTAHMRGYTKNIDGMLMALAAKLGDPGARVTDVGAGGRSTATATA